MAADTLIRDEPNYDWSQFSQGYLYGIEQIESDPHVAITKGIDYMMGWEAAWVDKYRAVHADDAVSFDGEVYAGENTND